MTRKRSIDYATESLGVFEMNRTGEPLSDDHAALLAEMRRRLMTDQGMARFMNDLRGVGKWTYDPDEDVWVFPDHQYRGSGRGYIVVKRGGDWFKAELSNQLS